MTKGEATRRRLVESAAEVFCEAGYDASYRDLVAASGLSKGAFYFHFPSKPELAVEVFRTKQSELLEKLVAEVSAAGSPLEQLRAAVRARARHFDQDRTLGCLPRLASALATEPGMADEVARFHGAPAAAIASFVRAAQDEGDVRPDVDADQVGATLFTAFIGIEERLRREPSGPSRVDQTEALLELVLDGIRTRPSASPTDHRPSKRRRRATERET